MNNKTAPLTDNFQKYFTAEFADTEELRNRAYEIRYQVYCDEFEYEPKARFPGKKERDRYDELSLHCLITHRSSGRAAGCVRLVPADVDPKYALLPFEKFCGDSLDTDFISQLNMERHSMCEISRLAVDGAFRRRSGEKMSRFGQVEDLDPTPEERRTFSLIAVAAYLSATALTDLTGRTNVFAMMEPFLPRLMSRVGISFLRAGKDMDYHGIRAPYFIRTQSALKNMQAELRELYEAIYLRISKSYWASVFSCQGRALYPSCNTRRMEETAAHLVDHVSRGCRYASGCYRCQSGCIKSFDTTDVRSRRY